MIAEGLKTMPTILCAWSGALSNMRGGTMKEKYMKAIRILSVLFIVAALMSLPGCANNTNGQVQSSTAQEQSVSAQEQSQSSAAQDQSSSADSSAAASDASSSTSGDASQAPAPPEKFVILHTNDVHGHLVQSEDCLGLGAVAQLKADYFAKGYDVLLLDAGDVLQGSMLVGLNQGADVAGFMQSAAYDAMALGNHEFDYGSDVLQQRMESFQFPVLCANIFVEATGEPFAQANQIFTLSNGAKVGVFGLLSPSTVTVSLPSNTAGLKFLAGDELYACAQGQIDELRAAGCSIVVCLGHLGEEGSCAPSRASDLVANTSGLDVFIDAHDHEVENTTVDNAKGEAVPVVETGCNLANIGVLTYTDGSFTEELVAAESYEGSNSEIDEQVAAAQSIVDEALSEVMGETAFRLSGDRKPGVRDSETNLADFCTDAILWLTRNNAETYPDAALLNGGGLRTSIEAGNVTLGNIRDVMPFDNQLCTVQVTGAQLLEAFEAATQDTPEEMGGFPQVSGITYTLDTTMPYEKGEAYPNSTYFAPANPGSRVTISDVGGKGFDLDATYTIATLNFIAQGGDTYYCFAEAGALNYQSIGYEDYQALQHYLQDELGGTVPDTYAQPQGRITVITE